MANLMYAKKLSWKFEEKNIDSKTFEVHPGYSDTNLQMRAAKTTGGKLKLLGIKAMNKVVAQTAEKGALPTLYAFTEDLEEGEFIGPVGFKEMIGNPTVIKTNERAEDEELRQKLWQFSEDELGTNFSV